MGGKQRNISIYSVLSRSPSITYTQLLANGQWHMLHIHYVELIQYIMMWSFITQMVIHHSSEIPRNEQSCNCCILSSHIYIYAGSLYLAFFKMTANTIHKNFPYFPPYNATQNASNNYYPASTVSTWPVFMLLKWSSKMKLSNCTYQKNFKLFYVQFGELHWIFLIGAVTHPQSTMLNNNTNLNINPNPKPALLSPTLTKP